MARLTLLATIVRLSMRNSGGLKVEGRAKTLSILGSESIATCFKSGFP
ncbi:MAG: hypothetical protein QGF78_00025 [Candidatus Bathyarchaeota archaeon]|nr:hypothetical protein [Candidatus Bathyarchaeota archaeon]